MPSGDSVVHPHAEVQGKSWGAASMLLSLMPPVGWEEQFLVQIRVEAADLQAGDVGDCTGRCFIPSCKGPGKFGVLGSCGQA